MKTLASFTASASSTGLQAASAWACEGVVDHTMLLKPPLTGSSASGPATRQSASESAIPVQLNSASSW